MSAQFKQIDSKKTQRANTCRLNNKKKYYLTTGRKTTEDNFKKMEEEILKPYDAAKNLKSMNEVKKYWEKEKNKKINERNDVYMNHKNYRSRLNGMYKLERLYVPDKIELPGGSLTEDIDSTFFTIVSGRPIKEIKNTRKYVEDIRNCFMTRLKTGYFLDEILLIDERHITEKKRLNQMKNNFISCQKGFEEFLKEDHISSSGLLESAKKEENKSKEKLQMINGLKEELKKLQAEVLVVEEKWRNLRMFQKFLYTISPSEWRKNHDPHYEKQDIKVKASDPCLFDSFREFPGDGEIDLEVKIQKFLEDTKESRPPELYFMDNPQEILNILRDLENNNLRALAHCKELDFPVEVIMTEFEKTRNQFNKDQKNIEEEIRYLEELVKTEENNAREKESKMKDIIFGLFKDLITNEEYLTITAFVEDAYEYSFAPNDSNLDLVTMIKEIELQYESLLLALDILPNEVMVKTTKNFYKERKRELKEAKEAEKKVHQMEILLKRLSKSLEYPKKRVKERKIVPRSIPPEELMFKYKLPKILSKEERDHLFFFGKTPDDIRMYKPLCL